MAAGHKTGGRQKGTPNKATNEIKALASVHGPAVIARLAKLSGILVDDAGEPIPGSESEATQALCMKELLDRGFGKSTQIIAGDDDAPPVNFSMKVKFVRPVGTGS